MKLYIIGLFNDLHLFLHFLLIYIQRKKPQRKHIFQLQLFFFSQDPNLMQIQLNKMLADFSQQLTYNPLQFFQQKQSEQSEVSINELANGKQTQKYLDFNNQFLESQGPILKGKKNETFPFLIENLQITQHSSIKTFQQIILPGSLIGCFSNFPYKNIFSFVNLLEIGQDRELYGLKNIRSFGLDGIIMQEWNETLLQQLMNVKQRFYFLIENKKQLHNFVYFCSKTLIESSLSKNQTSEMSTSSTINIFPVESQIFLVKFQRLFQKQPNKQCLHYSNTIYQSQEFTQNLFLDFKLDKTLQTCVHQKSNKLDFTEHSRDQFSSQEETAEMQIESQQSEDWLVDASFFSETQNGKDIQSSKVNLNVKDVLCDFEQGFYNNNQWALHKRDIYNGIDGEDNRQVIFSSNQLPKKYARSVCSYQQLQRIKKDLQESFELQELSDF